MPKGVHLVQQVVRQLVSSWRATNGRLQLRRAGPGSRAALRPVKGRRPQRPTFVKKATATATEP